MGTYLVVVVVIIIIIVVVVIVVIVVIVVVIALATLTASLVALPFAFARFFAAFPSTLTRFFAPFALTTFFTFTRLGPLPFAFPAFELFTALALLALACFRREFPSFTLAALPLLRVMVDHFAELQNFAPQSGDLFSQLPQRQRDVFVAVGGFAGTFSSGPVPPRVFGPFALLGFAALGLIAVAWSIALAARPVAFTRLAFAGITVPAYRPVALPVTLAPAVTLALPILVAVTFAVTFTFAVTLGVFICKRQRRLFARHPQVGHDHQADCQQRDRQEGFHPPRRANPFQQRHVVFSLSGRR